MYSFLVLGIIPGTNIAISFNVWLILLGTAVALFVRQKQEKPLPAVSIRQLMPATRLHRRFN